MVTVITQGAFHRDPLYNMLQIRDVKVSAHVKCIATAEEVKAKSVDELDALLAESFINVPVVAVKTGWKEKELIGNNEFSYFCFPKGNVSVTKARLATEELYKMKKRRGM